MRLGDDPQPRVERACGSLDRHVPRSAHVGASATRGRQRRAAIAAAAAAPPAAVAAAAAARRLGRAEVAELLLGLLFPGGVEATRRRGRRARRCRGRSSPRSPRSRPRRARSRARTPAAVAARRPPTAAVAAAVVVVTDEGERELARVVDVVDRDRRPRRRGRARPRPGRCACRRPSFEMWSRPSRPGRMLTNAPNLVMFTTGPCTRRRARRSAGRGSARCGAAPLRPSRRPSSRSLTVPTMPSSLTAMSAPVSCWIVLMTLPLGPITSPILSIGISKLTIFGAVGRTSDAGLGDRVVHDLEDLEPGVLGLLERLARARRPGARRSSCRAAAR